MISAFRVVLPIMSVLRAAHGDAGPCRHHDEKAGFRGLEVGLATDPLAARGDVRIHVSGGEIGASGWGCLAGHRLKWLECGGRLGCGGLLEGLCADESPMQELVERGAHVRPQELLRYAFRGRKLYQLY